MPPASRQKTEHVSSQEPRVPSPSHQGNHDLDFQWALRRHHPLPSVQGRPGPLKRRGERAEMRLPGFLCTLVPWSWLGPHGLWGFSSQLSSGVPRSPLWQVNLQKNTCPLLSKKKHFFLVFKNCMRSSESHAQLVWTREK